MPLDSATRAASWRTVRARLASTACATAARQRQHGAAKSSARALFTRRFFLAPRPRRQPWSALAKFGSAGRRRAHGAASSFWASAMSWPPLCSFTQPAVCSVRAYDVARRAPAAPRRRRRSCLGARELHVADGALAVEVVDPQDDGRLAAGRLLAASQDVGGEDAPDGVVPVLGHLIALVGRLGGREGRLGARLAIELHVFLRLAARRRAPSDRSRPARTRAGGDRPGGRGSADRRASRAASGRRARRRVAQERLARRCLVGLADHVVAHVALDGHVELARWAPPAPAP